ncbi:MAG: type IV toxin-antitoxin system AbiEi family antitoxin domain-containing protein [Hydrogenovibrio sp.]
MSLLSDYARPNDKISQWLASGVLISLKRGLYVVGSPWRQGALCLPLMANRLYGPSCVSLEYALAWHGLIPERVVEVTSVCTGRGRALENSLGRFSYVTVPESLFPVGLTIEAEGEQHFWMASPTKAVCDKVLLTRHLKAVGKASMRAFLFEDLRLDEEGLRDFDASVLNAYVSSGHKPRQFKALRQVLEALA